jgi:DNA-binding CsgD family transcriptional regulator
MVDERGSNGSRGNQQLSTREIEIVRRAAQGMIDKEIAREMHVSLNTIRTYWTRIRKKLNAVNRAEVIAKVGGWMAHDDSAMLTSRQHSFAAQLASAFETAPWGYLVLNSSGAVVAANNACTTLFERPTESILGQCPDAEVELFASQPPASIARVLEELGTGLSAVGSIRRADHTNVSVSLTFQVMETPLGTFYGLLIRDSTQ